MEALSWALTAAAVLLLLYAIRVVLQERDDDHPGRKAGLGCGFFFLACLFWSLASARWVGGYLNAFRLGMGIFLVAPALGALRRPHGSRLVIGLVGLMLGIVLAGPVAREVWTDWSERMGPRRQLRAEIDSLLEDHTTLAESLNEWDERRLELREEIGANGYDSFDSAAGDPATMQRLEELATVIGRTKWAQSQLVVVQERLSAAEAELARLKEDADSPASGLEALGFELPEPPSAQELTPVEEYARRKELQAIFEHEFPK